MTLQGCDLGRREARSNARELRHAGVILVAGLLVAGSLSADETVVVSDPAEGSVAPYVPTVEEDVELMLDVAGVRPGDYVIDLGSGDGRIAIAAAARGAFAHGVEIEPVLVEVAQRNARERGVADRVAFVEGDIFEAQIADASVVTLYLFPEANIALRPKLLAELAPGTRVVSNSFDMGDWRPDVHDMSARSSGGILLWIVPADVEGEWAVEIGERVDDGERADRGEDLDDGEDAGGASGTAAASSGEAAATERYALRIEQDYQNIEVGFGLERLAAAEPHATTAVAVLTDAVLSGDRIAFRVDADGRSYAFSGRVDGDAMSGYVQIRDRGMQLRRWRASR